MPMTGSDGTWMYGFVGFAAIAFTGCLYLLLDERRKIRGNIDGKENKSEKAER